ncbi:hypothetical protein AC579_6495 [Pseudocercospora musae]|uniref:Uncharacterized protein n=1 Tax=Pseudocercospora musae TaxID=113226 RepID=A0A139I0M9_9PEZI|nr:hypothetical protein AC579_6495 [Pseudocercospora musae]
MWRVVSVAAEAFDDLQMGDQATREAFLKGLSAALTVGDQRRLERVCRCGRWYMAFLEQKDAEPGILAMLGKSTWAAHKMGFRASTIDQYAFVRTCLSIPGFRDHMSKISYAVTQCFQSLLQSLHGSWTSESRIVRVLAKPALPRRPTSTRQRWTTHQPRKTLYYSCAEELFGRSATTRKSAAL